MVEYGTYVKLVKVEVYLIEFRLCVHPNVNDTKTFFFSGADNISECGSIYVLNKACSLGMAFMIWLWQTTEMPFKAFTLSYILNQLP